MTYAYAVRHLTGEDCGFMINGVFLDKGGKNQYRRSKVFRWNEDTQLVFYAWLKDKIADIVADFKAYAQEPILPHNEVLEFLPNFTVCHNEKWPCPFLALCLAESEEHREQLVKLNYKAEIRNPLTFQE